MIRWLNSPKRDVNHELDRQSLPDAVLSNEGIYSVQGPPGTGKTYLACDVIKKLLDEDREARILVRAKEHQALRTLRAKLLSRCHSVGAVPARLRTGGKRHPLMRRACNNLRDSALVETTYESVLRPHVDEAMRHCK